MTDSYGGGMAGGLAVGYLIGSSSKRDEERARQRRLNNKGHDQILLKLNSADVSELTAKKAVAGLFPNEWYVRDGRLREKGYGWAAAVITFLVFGFALMLANAFLLHFISWEIGIVIVLAVSIFLGYRDRDEDLSYVSVGTSGQYTTVLIKKYDGDGNRNLDDDDLDRLHAILEGLVHGKKERAK